MSRLEVLIKELCPDGVIYRKLGDIATIVRGASPRPIKNYITDNENGINWIKIGDVKAGSKYITATEEKITRDGAMKSRMVKPGDFILSNSMSFGRPYILKTIIPTARGGMPSRTPKAARRRSRRPATALSSRPSGRTPTTG